MGWGGKGKGKGWGAPAMGPACAPAMGPAAAMGPGWGRHHGHYRHGPRPGVIAAEAGLVGLVAGAAIATAVARPRPRPRPRPQPAVIVVEQPQPYVIVGQQQPAVVYANAGPKGKGKGKKGKTGQSTVVVTQPVEPPPLGVTNVILPADAMEKRHAVNQFGVDVFPVGGGAPWRVYHRYNDFHSLHERLRGCDFEGTPFPGKGFMVNLGKRREGLQAWLRRAVQGAEYSHSWREPLRAFLGAQMPVPTAAEPVAPMAPAPMAPPAQAPWPAAHMAPPPMPPSAHAPPPEEFAGSTASEDAGLELEVEVPDSVGPGQLMGVQVPSGEVLTLEVPAGHGPGSKFHVLYDEATHTLTLVS